MLYIVICYKLFAPLILEGLLFAPLIFEGLLFAPRTNIRREVVYTEMIGWSHSPLLHLGLIAPLLDASNSHCVQIPLLGKVLDSIEMETLIRCAVNKT